MRVPAILARLIPSRLKAAEGQYRPGPYMLPNGWLPASWGQYLNFWQMGYDPLPYGQTSMVEACVSAYAQTVAMCPGAHWREFETGGRERVKTSALSRVLRVPNDYQTASDFLLNVVRSLYLEGNAYALGLRNDRFEITSLHLMNPRQSAAWTAEGEIFYELGGNSVIDSRFEALNLPAGALRAVPARDVLHVKLHTPRDVLKGETPLTAAALAMAASSTALSQMLAFFQNQSRPSGVLQTDLTLTGPQVTELRERWNEQAAGMNRGGTPILTSGLKWAAVSMSAQDTQLMETMKLSDQQIAEVFRVPMAILGVQSQQPMGSTEALMQFWIANGLGFALNQIELAYDKTFGLTAGEYTELDTAILLRSAFKERLDALRSGVIGGIYSPNEARAMEGLPPAKAGDEPRVQQQVVPLSFALEPPQAPAAITPPSPPDATAPDAPADGGDGGDQPEGKAHPSLEEWRGWLQERRRRLA